MSAPRTPSPTRRPAPAQPAPAQPAAARVALKDDPRPVGEVDGAWWPRSRVLVDELRELSAGVDDRLGPVTRVGYNLRIWPSVPRRTTTDGHLVRLGGFASTPPDVVDVFGAHGRLCLLVVPPESSDADARRCLDRASAAGNDDVATLLAGAGGERTDA
ncbi:DUF5994 family protein [Pseudonocardia sp. ICBG162]|uniref:DUF5994 family protein n=1 Tax=Pseudonocardia sp. ICBG162 TaxID=2846761 RepID=UPI001CF6DA04|nr:DUF5994 family protein [Pseudonocardia sp. ICBG162]